jgi:MarC family integral membrane protein
MNELESLLAAFVIDTFLLLLIVSAAVDRDRTQDRAGAIPGRDRGHAGASQAPRHAQGADHHRHRRRVVAHPRRPADQAAAFLAPGALGIASGIILLVIGVAMVLGRQIVSGGDHPVEAGSPDAGCRVPAGCALPAQPGRDLVLVTLPAEASSIAVLAVAVGVVAAVLAFDVVVFRWAVQVSSKLNASRMLVTEKVFGFLLAALGCSWCSTTVRRRRDSPNDWSLSRPPAPRASGFCHVRWPGWAGCA